MVFVCLLMFALVAPLVCSTQSNAQSDNIGSPKFTTESSVTPVLATSKTVPHWASSFVYKGVTYPYTMVGTNPASSNSTTTVDVAIIPFDFVFPNGFVLSGTSKVGNVLGSP